MKGLLLCIRLVLSEFDSNTVPQVVKMQTVKLNLLGEISLSVSAIFFVLLCFSS